MHRHPPKLLPAQAPVQPLQSEAESSIMHRFVRTQACCMKATGSECGLAAQEQPAANADAAFAMFIQFGGVLELLSLASGMTNGFPAATKDSET